MFACHALPLLCDGAKQLLSHAGRDGQAFNLPGNCPKAAPGIPSGGARQPKSAFERLAGADAPARELGRNASALDTARAAAVDVDDLAGDKACACGAEK